MLQMIPPMGGLLLAWSDGGGLPGYDDGPSDSESEADGEGDVAGEADAFWSEEDIFDNISQEVLNSQEPKEERKTCVSKAEALEMVTRKINRLSPVQAARELLMAITGDSIETMESKDEKRMLLEVDHLARKIRQLLTDHRGRKFKKSPELLEENLATFSQNSFVKYEKEQSYNEAEDSEDETKETKETKEKVFRKALNKLVDKDTMKRRTDAMLTAVREEATKQGVTTTELLSYLLYRESYNEDKKLAEAMLRRFKGGEVKVNKVSDMKTLAMVLRGRFGRSTFFYVRRTLRPYKGFGQQFLHKLFRFIQFFPAKFKPI